MLDCCVTTVLTASFRRTPVRVSLKHDGTDGIDGTDSGVCKYYIGELSFFTATTVSSRFAETRFAETRFAETRFAETRFAEIRV